MSIPFGKHFGATFKEAIVVLESLQRTRFRSKKKERVRLSMIDYVESKLWYVYPLQCEDYYHKHPTPRKFKKLEREKLT